MAEDKLKEILEAGVIPSPMVLVKKKDSSQRFCVDYQCLNDATHKESYPLPRIYEALDYIAGSWWIT